MRGDDDCCNLVGRRAGKQTVRNRRIHGIQYNNIIEEELRGKKGRESQDGGGKWSCASLASR